MSSIGQTRGPWERYGWLMAAIWMVFLFYPASSLVASPAPLGPRAIGWAGLLAFAVSYIAGFIVGMRSGWAEPSPAAARLYGLAVLCAAATIPAIGWEATSFLPFLMSFASYVFNRVWHWVATIAALAIMLFETALELARGAAPSWTLLAIVVMMGAVNTVTTWLLDRSKAADALRMELVTSEEREAVARDVHDLLGHSLTVVKLKAELAARLLERDPAAARAELEEIVRLTGEAIAGVRGTVTGLRSEGLAQQLATSRAALESAGIETEVRGDAAMLSPAQSLPAAWIVREATTNILRHSGAARVLIEIAPGTVVVEDDGIGRAGAQGRPGNGQRGMAERAAAAGAVLRIGPGGTGRGTRRGEERDGRIGTRVSVTW